MQTSSAHASTCGAIGPCGDHDARSSICAPSPSAASEPNPFERVLVAVPDAEWYAAVRESSASTSHDHATSASRGSTPISGSSGACAKHTMRHGPFHGAGSSGSCSRMKRPVPIRGVDALGSRDARRRRARAQFGASPVGAGISRTERSSRNAVPRTSAAARAKDAGAVGGRWSVTATD